MVTAILPPLTDESDEGTTRQGPAQANKPVHNPRYSVASDLTITPERYRGSVSNGEASGVVASQAREGEASEKPSQLAGYVGLFTGCGALVALSLFLPLPARFGEIEGVTPAEAVTDSFYVVGFVSFAVAIFVFIGLRNLKGEEGKGWKVLLRLKGNRDGHAESDEDEHVMSDKQVLPIPVGSSAAHMPN